jgi:hypothetical protein
MPALAHSQFRHRKFLHGHAERSHGLRQRTLKALVPFALATGTGSRFSIDHDETGPFMSAWATAGGFRMKALSALLVELFGPFKQPKNFRFFPAIHNDSRRLYNAKRIDVNG